MRVATKSFYQGVQERILKLSSDLKKMNEKISTGKNINRPSDDPLGLIDSLGLKTMLSQIGQYHRNMQRGESWLNLSESILSQVLDLVDRAQEIAIQAANETQSAETRSHAATEVGHLLDQAIILGNTRLGGTYIFAGYRTGTTPFFKVTAGGIETAHYAGDTNDFQILIGKDELVTVGTNGQTVFINSGIFDTLGRLKKALEENDRSGINQQITGLNAVHHSLNNNIADIGAKANRLRGKGEVLNHLDLNLRERLSSVEDADYSRVIIRLRETEIAYEAALLSTARIAELSILNYLR